MSSVAVDIEVASQFPAEKAFKIYNDFDTIAPKVNPGVFKSIETVEGNGGVGTIKILTFGDAVPFTSGKYKVDAIDPNNYTYSYTFIEGDNLMGIADSITTHVKVVYSPEGGSVYKQTIIYNCKGDAKPSEGVLKVQKDNFEKTYKAIEAYAAAHPDIY